MDPRKKTGDVSQHPQEKNLRERPGQGMETENTLDPVSFDEGKSMTEDEDLDRIERDMPKGDDMDDVKDS